LSSLSCTVGCSLSPVCLILPVKPAILRAATRCASWSNALSEGVKQKVREHVDYPEQAWLKSAKLRRFASKAPNSAARAIRRCTVWAWTRSAGPTAKNDGLRSFHARCRLAPRACDRGGAHAHHQPDEGRHGAARRPLLQAGPALGSEEAWLGPAPPRRRGPSAQHLDVAQGRYP
jgi:hypothetical protein